MTNKLTNHINNQSIIPSTDVIQLTLTLKMTTPHRLWKYQSLSTSTVLFRTTFTRTIKHNLLLIIIIINIKGEKPHVGCKGIKKQTKKAYVYDFNFIKRLFNDL